MKQAKTLTAKELRRVLDYVATRPHAARNRVMLLMTHWAGMRVGEVAALRICDVLDSAGQVKPEIRLGSDQTKGRTGRTVVISERLRKEMNQYAPTLKGRDTSYSFFPTQKQPKRGFTANTLAQHLLHIYRGAGIEGASSHSGRRTFITNLAAKGVSVRVLMSLAGHASISTTQAYIDINDEMKRQAVELV